MRGRGRFQIGILGAVMTTLAALTGCTTTPATAAVSPTSLTFASTAIGSSSSKTLTISNSGTEGQVVVESVGIAGADAAMFSDNFNDDSSVSLGAGINRTTGTILDDTRTFRKGWSWNIGYDFMF